ncbi:1225_t:CDS:1, partial [Racocetra persica]
NVASFQLNKRTTEFNPCPYDPDLVLINVVIAPDPLVGKSTADFKVSGTLNHEVIARQAALEIAFDDAVT